LAYSQSAVPSEHAQSVDRPECHLHHSARHTKLQDGDRLLVLAAKPKLHSVEKVLGLT
jgi:hypothetical protein